VFGAKAYNRSQVYEEAEKARGKGKKKKAIAGYRKILEHEPDDFQVHGKLAPLLADESPREAWASFEKAAKGHLDKGFADRALAVYRQAADALPFIPDGWEQIATLHEQKGRKADAVKVLVEGQYFYWKTPADLEIAVRLLNRAVALEAWHVDGNLALARAQKKGGDTAGGVARLSALLDNVPPGPDHKRVLRARMGLQFTFGHLWSWLRGR
jgi:tetratricopeptide (TPR) repeat protein